MRLNKSKQNEMKNDTIKLKRGSSFLAVNCQVKSTLTIMCLIPVVYMVFIFVQSAVDSFRFAFEQTRQMQKY